MPLHEVKVQYSQSKANASSRNNKLFQLKINLFSCLEATILARITFEQTRYMNVFLQMTGVVMMSAVTICSFQYPIPSPSQYHP